MRRLLRRRVLPAVVLLVVAALFGGWLYARSDAAARKLSQQLEDKLGSAARIERIHAGLLGTSFTGLAIHEPNQPADAEPLLAADEVDLNVSTIGAVAGRRPSRVTVRGARMVLRYDRNGFLLTKLPSAGGAGPLPTIHVKSGTLTIRQEGREDTVFTGLEATLTPADGGLALSGSAHDPDWGQWTGEGLIPVGPGPMRLAVKTITPQPVTPELLRRVPLVSPSAWKHVVLAGTTPGKLEIAWDPTTRAVRCRIDLEPTGTSVDVPAIDLHVTDAAGKFVSEGKVITLSDVVGRTADGTVRVDGRMDFTGKDYVLRYTADLARLDVQKLPRGWRFPKNIAGRLTGRMEFTVTLAAGGAVRVDAFGRTTVTEARLNGEPVPPIDLDVRQGAGGLEFAERSPPNKHEALKPPTPDPRPASVAGGMLMAALRVAEWAAQSAEARDRQPLELNLTLRDVDLVELLRTVNVEAPAQLGGRVSARVRLTVPAEGADDIKGYRLSGTVTSHRLLFEDLGLEDVTATVDLRDGKFTVKDLVGTLPAGEGRTSGTLRADGEIGVGKDYPFKVTLSGEHLPLEAAARLRNVLPDSVRLAGEVTGKATLSGTLSPLNVRSDGSARLTTLRVGPVPVEELGFRWESDAERIRFREASGRLFGGEVTGQFDLPFSSDEAGTGTLTLDNLDLTELSKGLLGKTNLKLEGKAQGSVKLRAPAAGEGERGTTAEVDLQAPSLKLQGVPARKIKGTGTYTAGVVHYALSGEALGGQVEVNGQYPPPPRKPAPKAGGIVPAPKAEPEADAGRIKFRRVRLSGLWGLLGVTGTAGPLDADLSGDLPLTTDEDGRLIGSGRVRADHFRWNGTDMAGAGQATVTVTGTGVTIEDATVHAGSGVASFRIAYDREDPDKGEAAITLTNVPASRLLYLMPELAGKIDMNVDGRLTTRMGREWRGSGVLTAARGKAYGIPVSDVRVPVDWVVTPGRGRTQVRVREATATAASGQLTAKVEVNLYNDLPPRVEGEVQFKNANLSQAFRDAGRVAGNVRMTGSLTFGADQYRGPADLAGRLDAKLGESQPFSLPVFSAMVPYLGSVASPSATVQEGEVRATLGKGAWNIQRLTLSGPSVDLYADGSVTTGGGLNLSVTATSRQRPSQAVMRRALPATALTPTQPLGPAGLASALGFLGNYVVHLEVTGTVDAPAVRLQTLRTLTDDAVRFFLLRYLTPIP